MEYSLFPDNFFPSSDLRKASKQFIKFITQKLEADTVMILFKITYVDLRKNHSPLQFCLSNLGLNSKFVKHFELQVEDSKKYHNSEPAKIHKSFEFHLCIEISRHLHTAMVPVKDGTSLQRQWRVIRFAKDALFRIEDVTV